MNWHMMKKYALLSMLLLFVYGPSVSFAELELPSSRNNLGHLSITGAALFLKPSENGIAYGLVTKGDNLYAGDALGVTQFAPGTFEYHSRVKSPQFHWNTGFRVSLAYQPVCSDWDFSAKWMHFKGNANDKTRTHFQNNDGELFTGNWSLLPGVRNQFGPAFYGIFAAPVEGSNTNVIDSVAQAKLDVDFNIIDFDLNTNLSVTSCMRFRPSLGVRIAYIDQKYHLANSYQAFTNILDPLSAQAKEKIKLNNDFRGYGIHAGMLFEYDLGCNLSLYGSGEATILKGCFDVCERYKVSAEFTNEFILNSFFKDTQKDNFDAYRAILDSAIGIRYRISFNQDACSFILQLSWENHLYFAQNQFQSIGFIKGNFFEQPFANSGSQYGLQSPVTQENHGDLSLSGWSLAAIVEF